MVAVFGLSMAVCVAAIVDWDDYAELTGRRAGALFVASAVLLVLAPWGTFRHFLPALRRERRRRAVIAGRAEAPELGAILSDLPRNQDDLVIYAERPWTPASRALVLEEPLGTPDSKRPELPGFDYFMHVSAAHHDAEFFPDDPVDGLIRLAEQRERNA